VIPIPTFPPVVYRDPIVLLFPVAAKILLIDAEPADTFVSIKLVVVILTVVIVPAITRFPERLRFPPV
jgi:membrane protein YdbS with pleckstrin-like domain